MRGKYGRFHIVVFTLGLGAVLTSLAFSSPTKDCLKCPADLGCGSGFHATETTWGNGVTGDWHDCYFGSCESHQQHDACVAQSDEDLDAEDVTDLLAAVRSGDDDRLASVLRRFHRVTSFNPGRQAIQVMGCDGSVRASIPVRVGTSRFMLLTDE